MVFHRTKRKRIKSMFVQRRTFGSSVTLSIYRSCISFTSSVNDAIDMTLCGLRDLWPRSLVILFLARPHSIPLWNRLPVLSWEVPSRLYLVELFWREMNNEESLNSYQSYILASEQIWSQTLFGSSEKDDRHIPLLLMDDNMMVGLRG